MVVCVIPSSCSLVPVVLLLDLIMPPKKPSGGQKASPPEVLSLAEGGDPVLVAISIIDKKARNLEKRKVDLGDHWVNSFTSHSSCRSESRCSLS